MNAHQLSSQARIENEVLVHFLQRLSTVQCVEQPFPHFFVENIFPAGIYADLLALPPANEQMGPLGGTKHQNADGGYNRLEMVLEPRSFEAMLPEQRVLWQGVHRALTAPQFKQAVYGKLAPGLMFRYGLPREKVSQLAGHPRTCLFRETEGYSIAPHPDGRKKVVTMQFALPPDRSQEELGTTFYQRSLDPRDWLSMPRGFKRAKQMPFLPNCAYAFVVLNSVGKKSWHGREKLAGEQGTRNSILHIYYAEPAGTFSYES